MKKDSTDKRIAFFPGSFDPYTIGHDSIVERALPLFDEIIIAVGINDEKRNMFSIEERLSSISELYKNEPKIRVVSYSSLTVEAAQQYNAQFILRGVRMIQDFEFEKNLAEVNRSLSGIETILLYTLPEQSHISSSIVRELIKYGKDVTTYLPKGFNLPNKNRSKE